MLDSLTLYNVTTLFRVEKYDTIPYEKFDDTWVSVTVNRDLDITAYERKVYTFVDALSDIGGLKAILFSVLAVLSSTWNYNAFDNFMVSRLFKI